MENEKEVWERLTAVEISTHTLRGERDYLYIRIQDNLQDFNSHAPWGA